MSQRRFVDIDEVLEKLVGALATPDDEILIPWRALQIAIAGATTLVVPHPEVKESPKLTLF